MCTALSFYGSNAAVFGGDSKFKDNKMYFNSQQDSFSDSFMLLKV
jgi:hypothetical protein